MVIDPDTGIPDFELNMKRFQSRSSKLPISYVVFDILRYDGVDLRELPLMERKAVLDRVVTDTPTVSKIAYVDGRGEDLFEAIAARKMEGVVSKRKDSVYTGKRSADWIKVINYQQTDVFITGYRKDEFGWLAAVPDSSRRLRLAGVIELGVSPTHKHAFYGVVKPLIIGEDRNFVYVEPWIRSRVKFRNWTQSGMLRSPVFVDFILTQSNSA